MTDTAPIAVTGATGGLGGRVAARLAGLGVPQRLLVRDPARAPELPGAEVVRASYDDADAVRAALDGVETLFLVSASEARDRVGQHRTAVDAAVAAGVQRIVYVSFLGAAPDATFTFARDHWATEEHIRATGLRHTFLRDSMYMDFVPSMVSEGGVIAGPAGDGRVAFVARDDIADVAVAVLTDDGAGHDGVTYDVTGPEALTMADAAAALAQAQGRPVTYRAETMAEARASRAGYGAPDWEVEGWITSYAAIATGELSAVSDTVARVAGHRPISLRELLRRSPGVSR
jgi:NAD(P)H dehydrogenase (quinone)